MKTPFKIKGNYGYDANGGKIEEKEVYGIVKGHLGIDKRYNLYYLSHIPSGRYILFTKRLKDAKTALDTLNQLPVMWESTDTARLAPEITEIAIKLSKQFNID